MVHDLGNVHIDIYCVYSGRCNSSQVSVYSRNCKCIYIYFGSMLKHFQLPALILLSEQ